MSVAAQRLGANNTRVNVRAAPFANQIAALLRLLVVFELRAVTPYLPQLVQKARMYSPEALERLRDAENTGAERRTPTLTCAVFGPERVAKAEPDVERLRERLRFLLRSFGLRNAADAANDAAGAVVIPGDLVERAIAGRAVHLGRITEWARGVNARSDEVMRQLRDDILRLVRETVIAAEQRGEGDRPTATELAREIRANVSEHADLSFTRAYRIARTETAIAQNTGAFTGYVAAGIEKIKWLAYASPIWPRRHDRMDGVTALVGELFTLPSGARMRYPHDPAGAVDEIVNCRCSIAPLRTRGRRNR